MTNSLLVLSRASRMLAEADTIQKTKELKSLSLTAADWAKRKGLGQQTVRQCLNYALQAERKMGGMLLSSDRARGGQPYHENGTCNDPSQVEPTLKELGIERFEAAAAQKLAALSDLLFSSVLSGELTRTAALRLARRNGATRPCDPFPKGTYRVLYADPPWKYSDTRDSLPGTTGVSHHYHSLSIQELCDLPVRELCRPSSVLFLWTTSPLLFESHKVINAWGFEYKASFVWDKVKHNLGHYNSVRHEFLLLCTRGSCLPDNPRLIDSVQTAERTSHSAKPDLFRQIIDQLYPHGPRLELFARTQAKGWQCWGNHAAPI